MFMFQKMLATFALVFFLGTLPSVWAVDGPVKAGNKFCPVSGDEIDPAITYVHEGREYGFCCKMCLKDFKKDPAKFIAKLEAGETGEMGASGEDSHSHDHAAPGHSH